jgi:predicted nucleic acid-binding protein
VILLDTGPIIALLDPADDAHGPCVEVLQRLTEPLATTVPVLTEAFHLLTPGSQGTANLVHFMAEGGLAVWYFNGSTLDRACELMLQYADHPMDLADASLVVAAETANLHKVFTLDRGDFATYRIRRGHRFRAFEVIEPLQVRR